MPPLKILKQPVNRPPVTRVTGLRKSHRVSVLPHHQTVSTPHAYSTEKPKNPMVQLSPDKHLGGSGLLAGLEQAVQDLNALVNQVTTQARTDPEANLLFDVLGSLADTVVTAASVIAGPVAGVVAYMVSESDEIIAAFKKAYDDVNKKPVLTKAPPQITQQTKTLHTEVARSPLATPAVITVSELQVAEEQNQIFAAPDDFVGLEVNVSAPLVPVHLNREKSGLSLLDSPVEENVSHSSSVLTSTRPLSIPEWSHVSQQVSEELIFVGGDVAIASGTVFPDAVTLSALASHSVNHMGDSSEVVLPEQRNESVFPVFNQELLDLSSAWTSQVKYVFTPSESIPILDGNIAELAQVVTQTTHSELAKAHTSSGNTTKSQEQVLVQAAWEDVRTVAPEEMIYPMTAPHSQGRSVVQSNADGSRVVHDLNNALYRVLGSQEMSGGQERDPHQDQSEAQFQENPLA